VREMKNETPKNPLLISKGHKPRRGKIAKCPICEKKFYKRPSMITSKYCSRECAHKGLRKSTDRKCVTCGKSYYRARSQVAWRGSKYCSVKCKGKYQRNKYRLERTDRYAKYPKKLSTFKKWVWKAFSDYIRERDNWECFTCGKVGQGSQIHAGHFIPSTKSATKFDEMNVHAQCYSCNIWKRGNAGEYAMRLIKKFGEKAIEDMVNKSNKIHIFTYSELEEMFKTYKKKIKNMKEQ